MSKKDKLIQRILGIPKDLAWIELVKFMSFFNYSEDTTGGTSGSARKFINIKTKHIINLHAPHNPPIVKGYAIKIVINALKLKGLL